MGGFCKDEFSGIIFLGWTFPGGSGAPSTGRVWGWDLLTAAVGLFAFFFFGKDRTEAALMVMVAIFSYLFFSKSKP